MNLEDGRVEIIAEGENSSIEQFLDRLNIRKYPIFVNEIKAEEEIYIGEFGAFKVIRDKNLQKEILSALSRGTVDIREMKEVLQGVKQDTGAMLKKQDLMLEKQDAMLGKQDIMIDKQDAMLGKQDIMIDKQDAMLGKQDIMIDKQDAMLDVTVRGFKEVKEEIAKGFGGVTEEIRLQRDDFKEHFMREVSEIRSEIAEIKATLARMQAAG